MSTAKSAPRGLKTPGLSKKKQAKPSKDGSGDKSAPRQAAEKPGRRRQSVRSGVRTELVAKLRAAISAGGYDTPEKLDDAVNKMIAEVFGSC